MPLMESTPGLGWLPDIPSVKDYTPDTPEIANLLNKVMPPATVSESSRSFSSGGGAAAPMAAPVSQVDLRQFCSPVEDQGEIGSCTANAAVGMVEYFERRAFGKHIDASRLFVYKTTRNLMGVSGDTGAYIRTAMGALVLFGAPPEKYWKYDAAKFDLEPTPFCYAFASNFQAMQYYRLDPNGAAPAEVLENVRKFLRAGFPSMFGFPVYDEFMNIAADAKVPMPTPRSKQYGGHAIMAVGFDDDMVIGSDKGALLIRNSWGTGWGDHGYAWMSYRYVTTGLAQDWWSLIKGEWVDTGMFGVAIP